MRLSSRMLALLFVSILFLGALTACSEPGFDYSQSGRYITMSADYRTVRIEVEGSPAVSETAVREKFNSYFAEGKFYLPIADATRPIANGDLVFLHYTGIQLSALEKAVTEGKIRDINCTGMTFDEIKALALGFTGGTTSILTELEIGSHSYIDGFESGLVGLVPAEHGNESPYPLHLSFPASYGNADLAGQQVVFFCALAYIADDSQGSESPTWSADTLTADTVNLILGLTGEDAYPTMEACLSGVRAELEQENAANLLAAKKKAVWEALVEMATFSEVPDAALENYINEIVDDYFRQMQDMYENYPTYYYQMFGTVATPTKTFLIQYMGYSADTYMQEMKADVMPNVKQEMLFHCLVVQEGFSLSDERVAELKEAYKSAYGEDIFDGYNDKAIYDQLLFDEFTNKLIKHLDQNGQITYKAA